MYYVWKLLPAVVLNKQHPNEIFIKNFLSLLDKIPIPKETARNKEKQELLCGREGMCEICFESVSVMQAKNVIIIIQVVLRMSALSYKLCKTIVIVNLRFLQWC